MGLMRNKNLEMEYLTAIEDLGIDLGFDTDIEEKKKELDKKDKNKKEEK